ncbi:hypothetical protein DL767_007440 [Monosporascus sp. MG133]|nr:hypothetical protein DL767_007440 [Monosporascus sp. MG133]
MLKRNMSSSQSSLGRRKRGSASSSKSNTTPNTSSTKSTGPYDRAFQQHLIDHGIYPHRYEYPDGQVPPSPDNMEEIMQALAEPRPSLSPSHFTQEDFRRFERADAHASKEWQVTSTVIPIIEGDVGDGKCVSGQIPFTNLDHLTDGSLVPGNPDRYYGARPEQLDRQIRTELSGYVLPSTQQDLPIVPNFFLAAKGPDGSLAVAGRQACYDGALGARGIRSLQRYAGMESESDGKAYTITSIYHGGTLKMYTSHPLPPASPEARPEYVTTQIKAYALNSDADTFRTGARAYRNARDWAKLQRDEAIREANEKVIRYNHGASATADNQVLSCPTEVSEVSADNTIDPSSQNTLMQLNHDSNVPSSFYDSETSADELTMDVPPVKRAKSVPRFCRRQSGSNTVTSSINGKDVTLSETAE